MPIEAGLRRFDPFAEAQNHALLIRLHPIEAGQHPENQQHRNRDQDAFASAEAAGNGTLQSFLAAANHLFQVWWTLAVATTTAAAALPPGTSGIPGAAPSPRAAAAAAAGLPMHILTPQVPTAAKPAAVQTGRRDPISLPRTGHEHD